MNLIIFNPHRDYKLSFLVILLAAFFPFFAYSACGTIPATYPLFSGKELKLDNAISINGNSVSKNDYKPNAAIDANGNVSTNVSLTLPDLDPSFFLSNNSSSDLKIENSSTINHTSEVFYDKIEIKKNGITVNFTGGGPFHIDELEVKDKNITLNFAAGIYYIKKFKIDGKEAVLKITSSPVIFHIGDEFKINEKDVNINTPGNVDDFLVYLHSGAKFESKEKNLDFTGLIYGLDVDKVEIKGKDSTIHGAIIVSGGEIKIEDNNISFIYTSADQTAIGNISTCQNSTGGGGDTAATNFNCVKKDTNGISGKLYTKTTTQPFRFDIVALQDASTIETSFANGVDHTLTIEVVNAEMATSCDAYPVLSPAISQTLNITASDSGTKTSAYMSSGIAYRKLKCRVTDTTNSPSVVGCSTDSFAIRPTEMTISSNLTNASSTGTPISKAGETFTLTATATVGYNGTPSINNSNIQAHTGANQTGSISGSFNAADSATGIATGSVFIYSEVGSLRFASQGIYDDNFTAVDQPDDCTDDFSNTKVSGKIGCKFSNTTPSDYFGRFTPDHFDVSLNTPVFNSSCSTFTYLDQPIIYSVNPIVTLSAKNSSGVTTQNYTGDYWKINPSGFIPVYVESSHPLLTLDLNPPIKTDSGNGTGLLTFADTARNILQITKGTITAPFDAEIALSFSLTDSDTITVANVDGVAQVNPVTFGATSAGNGISFSGSKNHRWGRISLGNTHGSELTPLSVPLFTEYFNGTHFIKNTEDNCTTFSLATDFSISDASDFNCSFVTQTTPVSIGSGSVKASFLNNTLIAGESELIISDNSVTTKGAGAGNTGYVDITSKLTNLPWLLYDWDGDTVNDNCPTARATFGIFKGNEKQIYFREVY